MGTSTRRNVPSRMPGFPTQVVVTPTNQGESPALQGSGVVLALVFDGGTGVAEAEVALIAIRAAQGAYGKDAVEDVLPESFSSGFVEFGCHSWDNLRTDSGTTWDRSLSGLERKSIHQSVETLERRRLGKMAG